MRRVSVIWIIIVLLVLLTVHSSGIVFLNVQWNEDTEEWEAMPLILEGEGLSLNRSYQNAYGYTMGLPEGPPFIITEGIIIRNTYDEHDEVDDWGNLSISTIGEGDKPFTLEFRPPDMGGDYSVVTVEGNLHIEGTSSDPVIFKGSYSISNGQWNHEDPSPYGPEISLEYCVFDSVGYGGTCSPSLFSIRSANISLENCQFSNFYPYETNKIIFCEMASIFDTPDERITIRECLFSNIILDSAPPIELRNPYGPFGEVRIESNEFRDVIFDDSSCDDGVLINLKSFAKGRITGNTGSGNTNSAFWISGTSVADGSITFRSSEELPFLVQQITVAEDRTLTIEEGSVLKMSELMYEANFRVYGTMIADGSVFTSWEDDSIGGDNDLQPEPPAVGYWGSTNEGGILVGQNATLQLRNSIIRYARSGIHAMGDALVDECIFETNEYNGFTGGKEGGIDSRIEIANSTFCGNGANGISFTNEGLRQTMMVDNVRSINNDRGMYVGGFETNPIDVIVTRSVFAGNEKGGVKINVGPGLQSLTMTSCNISGNFSAGINTADYDGDEAILRFESCLIAGNGYDFFTGEGTHGAGIVGGRPFFINNTVAWNKGDGYYNVPPYPYGGEEDVANNIFIGNQGYGYTNYVELPSRFSHNVFWENDDGELRIDADEGDFLSAEDLQALGGDYATNTGADPEMVAGFEGVVDSVRYLPEDNLSYLFSHSASLDGRDMTEMIVRPDKHEAPWYFITRHSGDTLVTIGDITAIAAQGDTLNVFDHHLDWASEIVDAGNSALPVGPLDIDGEHRMIDGDGNTLPDVDIGADEYGADSVTLVLISPQLDDYWVSEEERNIAWSAVGIDTVNLYFQAPYDPDSNLVAIEMELPATDGKYKWTVPDSLSTHCKVIIEDDANANHFVESDFFTIRSPILARIDFEDEYEAYDPRKDGWQFGNIGTNMWPEAWWSQFDYLTGSDPFTGQPYPEEFTQFWSINAQPEDFPDWPLFVEAFGTNQCYIDTPSGPVHSPAALWNWSQIKGRWGGSCFGFAQSSYQAFDDKMSFLASFPDVDNFDSLYALEMMQDHRHRKAVNLLMTRQYSREFLDHVIVNRTKSPTETLGEIEEMLLDDYRDDRVLLLFNNNGVGGHAVNPYRVKRDDFNPNYKWIYVYDSNVPGDRTARIGVHMEMDTWSYFNLPTWGGAAKLYLANPASDYLSHTALCSPARAASQSKRIFLPNSTHHEFYNTPGVAITISDGSGHSIGFADSMIFNTIPEAVQMIPLAAEYTPPIGYMVPAGAYTAEMSDFPDTLVTFSVARDSTIFSYVRSDAGPSQRDHVVCGDGILIGNYDGVTKVIGTRAIKVAMGEERVFDLLGIGLAPNDSIQFEAPDKDVFIAANYGGTKGYNLGIRRISGAGESVFEHEDITLPAGTGHKIVPVWEDLVATPIKIYIDSGNDGSIDDSIFVDNESVATLLQHFSAEFRGTFIEIGWRLSEIDEGVEFGVSRAGAGGEEFHEISDADVVRNGLSFIARDYTVEYGETYRYRVIYTIDSESRLLFETDEISTPVMPLRLNQNYPNPFNPTTVIRYYLPADEHVILEIFDVSGRRVARLLDRPEKKGHHVFEWNGQNQYDKPVSSGIYFYRLRAGKQSISKKMIILR
jgi:hypothetical protein